MLRFQCPRCRSVLEASESKAGTKTSCPKCQQRLQIPLPPPSKTVLAPLVSEPRPVGHPPPKKMTAAVSPAPRVAAPRSRGSLFLAAAGGAVVALVAASVVGIVVLSQKADPPAESNKDTGPSAAAGKKPEAPAPRPDDRQTVAAPNEPAKAAAPVVLTPKPTPSVEKAETPLPKQPTESEKVSGKKGPAEKPPVENDDLPPAVKPKPPAAAKPNPAPGSGAAEKASEPQRLRSLEEIKAVLNKINTAAQKETDPAAAEREAALRRLKFYRYLAGVPYEHLTLDDTLTRYAAAAARLCQKHGRIDHNPPNPGLPEEEYQFALKGTRNCNLLTDLNPEFSLSGAVDGFVADPGKENSDHLAHRRWCLGPFLHRVGFGRAGAIFAMWATDQKKSGPMTVDYVAYPVPGLMPIELFDRESLWSVSVNPEKYATPDSSVRVAVYPTDPSGRKAGPVLPLTGVHVSKPLRGGIDHCIIFDPGRGVIGEGKGYLVEIQGIRRKDGKPAPPLCYPVRFVQSGIPSTILDSFTPPKRDGHAGIYNQTKGPIQLLVQGSAKSAPLDAGGLFFFKSRLSAEGITVRLLSPEPNGKPTAIQLRNGDYYAVRAAGKSLTVHKLPAQPGGQGPADGPKDQPESGQPAAEASPQGKAESVPPADARRDARIEAALAWLAKNQLKNGGWAVKDGANPDERAVTASLCGLALMASGDQYRQSVSRAAAYVSQRLLDPIQPAQGGFTHDQSNWRVAIGGLFLLEYHAYLARHKAQPPADYRRPLASTLVSDAFRRMEPSGGWGHTPRHINALGYLELEVMSNWMLAMLGAARKEGAELPADPLARALTFIANCCAEGKGAVGYDTRPKQVGFGCPCRTGGAVFAFGLLDQQGHRLYPLMARAWREDFEDSAEAHGSAALGMLGSALGARQLGDEDWRLFGTRFFPYVLAHANADGSFKHTRGRLPRSVGFDHVHGPAFNTGIYALLLQLDRGNLAYLGRRHGPAVPAPKGVARTTEPLEVGGEGAAGGKSGPINASVENRTGRAVAMSLGGFRLPKPLQPGATRTFGASAAVIVRFTLDGASVSATLRENSRYALTLRDGKLKLEKLP